jgi:hypothetical protein
VPEDEVGDLVSGQEDQYDLLPSDLEIVTVSIATGRQHGWADSDGMPAGRRVRGRVWAGVMARQPQGKA